MNIKSWCRTFLMGCFFLYGLSGQFTAHSDTMDDDVLLESLDQTPDPLEPMNRVIFKFNMLVDGFLLKPFVEILAVTMPTQMQICTRNFIDNFFTPLVFVNNVLQGDPEQALVSFYRFTFNTVFGFFGLFDVAQHIGLTKKMTTLNETLEKWGIETGPYLVLPILGPSSFRDTTGKLIGYYADPAHQIAHNSSWAQRHRTHAMQIVVGMYALDGIMLRVEHIKALEELEKASNDFYVMMRSVYFERQKNRTLNK